MPSAKTHGLTKEMHLGNEEQKPNVLIYVYNYISKLPLSTQLQMITHHNQLPVTSVHTQNNKLTMTLFSVPEMMFKIPRCLTVLRKVITIFKIISKIQ